MFSNGTNSQSLVGLTPTGVNSLSNTSFNIPSSLSKSLNTVNTTANLGSKFFNNLSSLGLGSKVGSVAGKASGLLGKVGGVGGVGDVMGVVSGVTDFFGAQGNTSQKQMQRGDAAVNTVAAGLSFIPGFGQAAGAALKLTNSLGKGLIKQPSIMKEYSTNQNVMSNSAAFGGVADRATDAEATRDSFKNSGIAGRLVGRNNSTRKRFEKAINQQSQTQTLLDQNQIAMDNAGSSADLFTTRSQFNRMGGNNLFNRGTLKFGKKGLKFQNGGYAPVRKWNNEAYVKDMSHNFGWVNDVLSGLKSQFFPGTAPGQTKTTFQNKPKRTLNTTQSTVTRTDDTGNQYNIYNQLLSNINNKSNTQPVINSQSVAKSTPQQNNISQPKQVSQSINVPTPSKNKVSNKGPVVSELWKTVTGTDWSQAKASGLSDGSLKTNLSLLNRLKTGENPLVTLEQENLKKKQDFKDKLHKSFAASITKSSNSVNDLTFPKTL